jgi:hypothetical protein
MGDSNELDYDDILFFHTNEYRRAQTGTITRRSKYNTHRSWWYSTEPFGKVRCFVDEDGCDRGAAISRIYSKSLQKVVDIFPVMEAQDYL